VRGDGRRVTLVPASGRLPVLSVMKIVLTRTDAARASCGSACTHTRSLSRSLAQQSDSLPMTGCTPVAGPPYEDLAFRIVNKEWEFSHKRGLNPKP